jgi:threonine aldolase
MTVGTLTDRAAARGVRLAELGRGRIRCVTHEGVTAADVDRAVAVIDEALRLGPATSSDTKE